MPRTLDQTRKRRSFVTSGGNSLLFRGNGADRIDLPNSLKTFFEANNAAVTVGGWFKARSFAQPIVNKRAGSGSFRCFCLEFDAGQNKLRFFVENTSGQNTQAEYSLSNLSLNEWTHVAGTYDGSNIRLYVNGLLVSTVALTGAIRQAPGDQFVIGTFANGSTAFNGYMRGIGLWSRAATAAEIQNWYRTSQPPATPAAFYTFNDGETINNTVSDVSGNGYTATAYGVPPTTTDVPGMTRPRAIDSSASMLFSDSAYAFLPNSPAPHNFATNLTGSYFLAFRLNEKRAGNYKIFTPQGERLDVNIEANTNFLFIFMYDEALQNSLVYKTNVSMVDGQWHYLIVNRNPTTVDVWLDGVKVRGSFQSTKKLNQNNQFRGELGFGPVVFNRVMIWNRNLSEAECRGVFAGTMPDNTFNVLDYNFLDQDTTRLTDYSGKGNHGTFVGGVYVNDIPTNRRANLRGMKAAYRGNGGNGLNATPTALPAATGALTYAVWATFGRLDTNQTIIYCRDGGGNGVQIILRNKVIMAEKGYGNQNVTSGFTPIVGQYYRIVYTYNGTRHKIYINGKLYGQSTFAASGIVPNALSLGFNGSAENLTGALSQFMVYPRAFTDADVMEDFASGRMIPGAVMYMPLDEGGGVTAIDAIGGANGTINQTQSYTSVVPLPKRTTTDSNIVPNGRMELIPPFVAMTTDNNRVIDGTQQGGPASQQSTDAMKIFGWKMNVFGTAMPYGARYDEAIKYTGRASMRLQGTQVKERVNCTLGERIYGDLSNNERTDIINNLIPVDGGGTYRLKAVVKANITNIVTNNTKDFIGVECLVHNGNGLINHFNERKLFFPRTSFDWMTVTTQFVMPANASRANIYFGIAGDNNNYADITAWFDEIELVRIA